MMTEGQKCPNGKSYSRREVKATVAAHPHAYLSFEAKEERAASSPITGRSGLRSSELRTDEELDFDFGFDLAFDPGLVRSLDLRSTSDPKMSS